MMQSSSAEAVRREIRSCWQMGGGCGQGCSKQFFKKPNLVGFGGFIGFSGFFFVKRFNMMGYGMFLFAATA